MTMGINVMTMVIEIEKEIKFTQNKDFTKREQKDFPTRIWVATQQLSADDEAEGEWQLRKFYEEFY
jgi:hypothetical protein